MPCLSACVGFFCCSSVVCSFCRFATFTRYRKCSELYEPVCTPVLCSNVKCAMCSVAVGFFLIFCFVIFVFNLQSRFNMLMCSVICKMFNKSWANRISYAFELTAVFFCYKMQVYNRFSSSLFRFILFFTLSTYFTFYKSFHILHRAPLGNTISLA